MGTKNYHITLFLIVLISTFTLISRAQPLRQWVAYYNGPAKSNDMVTSMAIDDSGGIIVTGWSIGVGTGADITTIKYNQDGVTQWIQRYNGTSSGEDKAVKVVVDTAENVYVTGWSAGTGLDIVTIKYNKLGTQQWVVRFNGIGNGDDKPAWIEVDDSMNVYVTGSSKGSGTGLDIVTLKYNNEGVLVWSATFNGPTNGDDYPIYLKLERYNFCYVGGVARNADNDFFVAKYDSRNGGIVWSKFLNQQSGANDILKAMIWRNSDELYLTGSTNTGTGNNILTMRVNGLTGDTVWTNVYDGPEGRDDIPLGIALHSNARVYVTGKTLVHGAYFDILILRYRQSNGVLEYENRYNGPANNEDVGISILGGGSPHVVGSSFGIGSGKDMVFIEFQGDLDINWVIRYNGVMNNDDIAVALASHNDAWYIAGTAGMKKGVTDFVTIKYVKEDSMKYRTITQNDLSIKGLSLKPYNAIGNFGNLRDMAFQRAFPKIKSGYTGAPGGMVLGIARPDSPNICGWIRFTKGPALIKFVTHTGTPRGFDIAKGIPFFKELKNPKLEHHNNKLAGELAALKINIGASDAEVTPIGLGDLIFDNGDPSNQFNGYTVRELALLVDNFLSYYRNYNNVEWARLDTILTQINNAFKGPYAQVSQFPLMVSGTVPVSQITFLKKNPGIIQKRLDFEPKMIDNTPDEFTLYQNYPNPFNPSTTIKFSLPQSGIVTLKIYNALGQEVAVLLNNDEFGEGEHTVEFVANNLASGVYFYYLEVSDFINSGNKYTQVKKMLLLR